MLFTIKKWHFSPKLIPSPRIQPLFLQKTTFSSVLCFNHNTDAYLWKVDISMFYWKNHVFIPYPHPLPQVCFLDHSFPSLPIKCCSTNGCTSAKINKNPEISNHPSTKNSKFISRFHPFRGKDSIISFYMGD